MAIDEFIGSQPTGAIDDLGLGSGRPRPPAASPSRRRAPWRRRYERRLAISDFLVLVTVVFGTQLTWLGLDESVSTPSGSGLGTVPYWA
ncbi:MAG TPA: sugar transferase, partial [Microbacterium sp.]|nr:sugar transferase [Microbacterium sp.]